MKTVKHLGLGLLLTVLVIACAVLGVLLFQNMTDAEDLRMEVESIRQQVGVPAEETPAPEEEEETTLARCDGGELRYYSLYTPLSFCYPTKLGAVTEEETGIDAEAREGTKYYLSFDKDENLWIDLETANFRKTGDSDVPNEVNFSCIDFTKSNNELVDCFFDDVVSMERVALKDRNALLVTLSIASLENPTQTFETTRLVVPGILEQPKMNADITLNPQEHLADIQKMLESI